jgi:hypothetical protein
MKADIKDCLGKVVDIRVSVFGIIKRILGYAETSSLASKINRTLQVNHYVRLLKG